jgi:hypothetical protein
MPSLPAHADVPAGRRCRSRDVAAALPRRLEHAIPRVPDSSRANNSTRSTRLCDRRRLLPWPFAWWRMARPPIPPRVASRLPTRQGATHHRSPRGRPWVGTPTHLGATHRPTTTLGSKARLGPPLPRHDRQSTSTDARGRARDATDGRSAAALREVQRVRRAVATRPRRARTGPLHQARHLRRDRALPSRPRPRIGL